MDFNGKLTNCFKILCPLYLGAQIDFFINSKRFDKMKLFYILKIFIFFWKSILVFLWDNFFSPLTEFGKFQEISPKIVSKKDQNWFSEKNKNFEYVEYFHFAKSFGIMEKVDLSAEI